MIQFNTDKSRFRQVELKVTTKLIKRQNMLIERQNLFCQYPSEYTQCKN